MAGSSGSGIIGTRSPMAGSSGGGGGNMVTRSPMAGSSGGGGGTMVTKMIGLTRSIKNTGFKIPWKVINQHKLIKFCPFGLE